MPRPDQGGKAGRKISVKANSFNLKIPEDLTIWHYDVLIDPQKPDEDPDAGGKAATMRNERKLPIALLRVAFELALYDATLDKSNPLTKELAATLAFDGRRNVYSPVELPFKNHSWEVLLPQKGQEGPTAPRDEKRKFRVTMRQVNRVDASVLLRFTRSDPTLIRAAAASVPETVTNAIQALQVLICDGPAKEYLVHGSGGRRFFSTQNAVDIPGGAQIWKGL